MGFLLAAFPTLARPVSQMVKVPDCKSGLCWFDSSTGLVDDIDKMEPQEVLTEHVDLIIDAPQHITPEYIERILGEVLSVLRKDDTC